jgi:hypothetical protein
MDGGGAARMLLDAAQDAWNHFQALNRMRKLFLKLIRLMP